tara:strand:+ start:2417 stop:2791 length:375 start_codon:yes stop_codon:yes gene_type:complete
MDDVIKVEIPSRRDDTHHLAPTQFEIPLYSWANPSFARPPVECFWGNEPPEVITIRFQANGVLNARRQVYDVHLVLALDTVPVQTWNSLGIMAHMLKTGLESLFNITVKPIDRTTIDVAYVGKK